MIRIILVACLTAVAGCATQDLAPTNTATAVAEPPCDPAKLPPRPVTFPADALKGDEDIWIMGITLWADRKARMAYGAQLETFAGECARR